MLSVTLSNLSLQAHMSNGKLETAPTPFCCLAHTLFSERQSGTSVSRLYMSMFFAVYLSSMAEGLVVIAYQISSEQWVNEK
jgi:hypothetical protein